MILRWNANSRVLPTSQKEGMKMIRSNNPVCVGKTRLLSYVYSAGGVVWRVKCSDRKLVCAVGSRNGIEDTKLLVLEFDV